MSTVLHAYKVFPCSDTPFSHFRAWSEKFEVEQIKKANDHQTAESPTFSVDSGVILFIDDQIFQEIVFKLDYGRLVEADRDVINLAY